MFAGLLAALMFGLVLTLLVPETLTRVAALYGSNEPLVGFLAHLNHGILIGGVFGLVAPLNLSTRKAAFYGLIFGFLWWVAGAVLLMPFWLGEGMALSTEAVRAALPTLVGYLIYGIVLGLLSSFLVENEIKRKAADGIKTA